MKILLTGGCGFIGSAVVRHLIADTDHHVVNVDKMTYAATLGSVESVNSSDRYVHEIVDICDAAAVSSVFETHRPDAVMHLAAESHVDRSIDGPGAFIQTNIVGTFTLLEAARRYQVDRFHHVSTDEVFGSLGFDDDAFVEDSPYAPHSPYSASKAGSDHLVMAWWHSYGLPVVMTNCSNNYGPFQFPEKLIPLMIIRALAGETLPVYGSGENVRDWLYVEDHARALVTVLEHGRNGQTYNVGGSEERSNLEVVYAVCDALDARAGLLASGQRRRSLINFTRDRPGHDLRYAINQGKIENELGWHRSVDFADGLEKTINWFLANETWWRPLLADAATERRGLAESATT